jgi:hypothetical protein
LQLPSPHDAIATHCPLALHPDPAPHDPHEPPQPSPPHERPAQFGAQQLPPEHAWPGAHGQSAAQFAQFSPPEHVPSPHTTPCEHVPDASHDVPAPHGQSPGQFAHVSPAPQT